MLSFLVKSFCIHDTTLQQQICVNSSLRMTRRQIRNDKISRLADLWLSDEKGAAVI